LFLRRVPPSLFNLGKYSPRVGDNVPSWLKSMAHEVDGYGMYTANELKDESRFSFLIVFQMRTLPPGVTSSTTARFFRLTAWRRWRPPSQISLTILLRLLRSRWKDGRRLLRFSLVYKPAPRQEGDRWWVSQSHVFFFWVATPPVLTISSPPEALYTC